MSPTLPLSFSLDEVLAKVILVLIRSYSTFGSEEQALTSIYSAYSLRIMEDTNDAGASRTSTRQPKKRFVGRRTADAQAQIESSANTDTSVQKGR